MTFESNKTSFCKNGIYMVYLKKTLEARLCVWENHRKEICSGEQQRTRPTISNRTSLIDLWTNANVTLKHTSYNQIIYGKNSIQMPKGIK